MRAKPGYVGPIDIIDVIGSPRKTNVWIPQKAAMGAELNPRNLTGHRFGRLLVEDRVEDRHNTAHYNCLCDCGRQTVISSYRLLYRGTTCCSSCAVRKPIRHEKTDQSS